MPADPQSTGAHAASVEKAPPARLAQAALAASVEHWAVRRQARSAVRRLA